MKKNTIPKKAAMIECLIMDIDGIFNDAHIYLGHHGQEILKPFHTHDGIGLRQLKQAGIRLAVISGRRSDILYHRLMTTYQIDRAYLGYIDKLPVYQSICQQFELQDQQIAYIGDDIPDLPCIQAAGLGITVPHAHQSVIKEADWVTTRQGGCGAVRETCDLIMQNKIASSST